jgi:hypothetical protein
MGTLVISNEYIFRCEDCGGEVEVQLHYREKDVIMIEPCDTCLESKYEQGVEDGKEEGSGDE